MIWDDHKNRCVGELMFKSQVYAVRLRRDRVVCVLENRVYCYRFKDLKLLMQVPTYHNSKGLIAIVRSLIRGRLAYFERLTYPLILQPTISHP